MADPDSMFVRYFAEIAVPFEQVQTSLLSSPAAWLRGLANAAEARGQSLLVEVGFGPGSRRIEKAVRADVGEPTRFPSKTILPMTWKAGSAESLFPALDSDIEVAPLGPHRTQIAMSARYRPPLGFVGRALDRAMLHRVAEATVKDFVDRLRDGLQHDIREQVC